MLIMAEPVRLETRVDRAWRDYAEARMKAKQSGDIHDDIEAGRAYWRFYREFCPSDVVPSADLPERPA